MPDPVPTVPPALRCDLVLRGGGNEWVIYPAAVAEIATKYRLTQLAGSSSGGMAAAFSAAAELGRATGGFERLRGVVADFAPQVNDLYQPRPDLAAVWAIADVAAKPSPATVWGVFRHVPGALAAGVAAFLVLGGLSFCLGLGFGLLGMLLGALVGAAIPVAAVASKFLLIQGNFWGIVPGIRQPGQKGPGIMDWVDQTFAHLSGDDQVMTFRDLEARGITLRLMAADLVRAAPLALPTGLAGYAWREDELRQLIPARVADRLVAVSQPAGDGLLTVPDPLDWPVVACVRMTIALPGAQCAVPLWRPNPAGVFHRFLLTDGGICSNFPIHFFDAPFPRWPTFGISLESIDPDNPTIRVQLPESPDDPLPERRGDVSSVGGLAGAVYMTVKDWADNQLATLPGFRERVVRVRNEASDGGLDPAVTAATLLKLAERGVPTGRAIVDRFDADAHRWTRFLVSMRAVEEVAHSALKSADPLDPAIEPLRAFLERYSADPKVWAQPGPARDALIANFDGLQALAAEMAQRPTLRDANPPRPAATFGVRVSDR